MKKILTICFLLFAFNVNAMEKETTFKKELFDKLCGFDESFPMFFSDVDLCKRVKNLNLDIFYTIKSKMIHIGGSSIYKYKISSIITSSISLIRFFFKHYNSKFNFILNDPSSLICIKCFFINSAYFGSPYGAKPINLYSPLLTLKPV